MNTGGWECRRNTDYYSLIVICFTLLFFTWMIRDSLCELHIKQESYELAAFLACKLKE
ncbi:small toxic polypeptide [Escherichia coli]|nr:small toxic polypeptide [Escherichia coli]